MENSDDFMMASGEGARYEWDILIATEKNGNIEPLISHLQKINVAVDGIDLRIVACLLTGTCTYLKKKGPVPKSIVGTADEPYARAARGDTSMFVALLREVGIRGDLPDLWDISDIFELKRKKGRRPMAKITKGVRAEHYGKRVRDLMDSGKTLEEAVEEVQALSEYSETFIKGEYLRRRKSLCP